MNQRASKKGSLDCTKVTTLLAGSRGGNRPKSIGFSVESRGRGGGLQEFKCFSDPDLFLFSEKCLEPEIR